VLKYDGAAGVDGVSCKDILDSPQGVEGFLRNLQEELRTKTYRPQAVKRLYIPKTTTSGDRMGASTTCELAVCGCGKECVIAPDDRNAGTPSPDCLLF